jgi:hypothetical protein
VHVLLNQQTRHKHMCMRSVQSVHKGPLMRRPDPDQHSNSAIIAT